MLAQRLLDQIRVLQACHKARPGTQRVGCAGRKACTVLLVQNQAAKHNGVDMLPLGGAGEGGGQEGYNGVGKGREGVQILSF